MITWMVSYGRASLFAIFEKSSSSSYVVVCARMNSVAVEVQENDTRAVKSRNARVARVAVE